MADAITLAGAATYGAGLLGASAEHPALMQDARLIEIERRILAIEAAMGLAVREGQMTCRGPRHLPFDVKENAGG